MKFDIPSGEMEMRNKDVPWLESLADLSSYIEALTDRQHDYGSSAASASMAAVAAFRFIAKKLGLTGFQAGCADLDFIRRTRMIDGPFMLVSFHNALYPQYDVVGDVQEYFDGDQLKGWLKEKAKEKLAQVDGAHPDVVAHWQKLASWEAAKQ